MPFGLSDSNLLNAASVATSGPFTYTPASRAAATKAIQLAGKNSFIGGEQLRQQQQALDLQSKEARAKMKRQNQIFNMLLGEGGNDGMLNNVFGNLMGGGGGGSGTDPFAALAGGGMSQPGFQEGGPYGPGTLPRPGGPGGSMPPMEQHAAVGASPGGGSAGAYGAGQRAALAEDFANAQRNALGTLEMRGLGGSSLVGPAMASVARQKQLAGGELEDRLFREQLQFRAAERAPLFGLLGQLLGGLGV